MKKNQLNLFDQLPQDGDGLSPEYKDFLNKEYTYRSDARKLANNMTANDYIHALTELPNNVKKYPRYIMKDSPQNNEENNSVVFDKLKQKAVNGDDDAKETLLSMVDLAVPSKNFLDEVAKGKDGVYGKVYDGSQDVGGLIWRNINNNPNINENHYRLLHEANPESVLHSLRKIPSDLKRKILSNEDVLKKVPSHELFSILREDVNDQSGESVIGPAQAKNILNHPQIHDIAYDTENLDHLLSKVSDTEKKSFIDKKLGIEGGERVNKTGEDITPEEFSTNHDWDNWNHGDDYNPELSKVLASSQHLSDEQAEHIKRHGSFDDKFNLYHNPHIDPRHGVEMFRKWREGHSDHGYDSDQLAEKFATSKNHKDLFTIDDLDPDYWNDHEGDISEAGDEYANNNYTMDDYFRDNNINPWDSKTPSDHRRGEDWVDEHLIENYDWKVDNANSKQNEGRTDYDALNKLAEKYDRSHAIDLDDFKEVTGHNHPSDIGMPELWDDKREYIDMDDVHDKLDEFGGPLSIDYSNHDNYTIHDHPDYDERYDEAVKAWRQHMSDEGEYPDDYWEDHSDDYYDSEGYINARSEGMDEWKKDHFENEVLPQLYSQSHTDDRFVPEHLRDHLPEYKQIKQDRVNKTGDGANGPFLDKYIKERSREHEYGEDQHFYEMVKDHANANNGVIDIGTMHKLYPNQKEKWKKIFENKGKLSIPEIDEKISTIPKTKYGISYGKWGGNKMQNINKRDQAIIRLDHSDESLAPIKENPEVYNTFKKVMDTSKRSGHPTKNNTIAWARVDMSDPKHWMVDELQSDFGKTVTQYLKNQGHSDKAQHIDEIAAHHKNWREALLNHIVKEAKKHGVDKISTHSPESKAAHTGAETTHSVYNDSYGKVPKSMGFKPVSGDTLPLTETGKSVFITNKQGPYKHELAMDHHAQMNLIHNRIADELGTNPAADTHRKLAEHHKNLFGQHGARLKQMDPDHGYNGMSMANVSEPLTDIEDLRSDANNAGLTAEPVPHKHDNLLNKPIEGDKALGGHTLDLSPKLIKHFIDIADALIKAEVIFINALAKNENSDKLLDKIRILKHYLKNDIN